MLSACTHPRSDNLVDTTDYPQLFVYDVCLQRFGGRHEWMGFIDADEFLVLTGGARSLPDLLRGCARLETSRSGHFQLQLSCMCSHLASFQANSHGSSFTPSRNVANNHWARLCHFC